MEETATAVESLEPLVGEWQLEVSVAGQALVGGRTTFRWLEDGKFLHQLAEGEAEADVPSGWQANSPMPVTTISGVDDTTGRMVQLYADARGVFRVYEMSLADGVWKLWRDAPGFHQRFEGAFGDDGRRISGRWEASEDGETWTHDFDLTYTKVG
jgi:hypothetical protein